MSFKKFNLFAVLKNPLFLGAIVVLLLFGFSFITSQKKESPCSVVFNKIDKLCLSGKEAFKIETLSLNLVQENTLKNFSSPFIISPRIYGAVSDVDVEERNEPIEYIVQEGDNTFSIIAKKFGVSENTILWANNLGKNSKPKIGQRLLILPVSGLIHLVQSRETVSEIAKKYKANTEKIIEFNELPKNGDIFKGDFMVIPDGIMPKNKVYSVKATNLPDFGPFISPTQGIITRTVRMHGGYEAVDIANEPGTLIVAPTRGKVIIAGYRGARCGNGIDIEHSRGIITRYCHLSKISVTVGENVIVGDEIGKMGYTGTTRPKGPRGCHLHFYTIGAKNPLGNYKLNAIIYWK